MSILSAASIFKAPLFQSVNTYFTTFQPILEAPPGNVSRETFPFPLLASCDNVSRETFCLAGLEYIGVCGIIY
jgi:hypothetical protein